MEGIEPPPIKLSAQQMKALEMIAKGESFSDIAAAINVDRGTIYRWRTYDPNFIAALNQWRGSVQSEVRDRLTAIARNATNSLKKNIDGGDSKMEIRLLDKMGYVKPGPTYPVDPYAIFGNGVEDETGRSAIALGMQRAAANMTPEQALRAAALGVGRCDGRPAHRKTIAAGTVGNGGRDRAWPAGAAFDGEPGCRERGRRSWNVDHLREVGRRTGAGAGEGSRRRSST